MKNLLLITLFTASTVWAWAQPGSSLMQSNLRNEPRFIENIEINPGKPAPTKPGDEWDVLTERKENVQATRIGMSIEQCQSLQFKYGMLMNREVEKLSNISLYSFIDNWWGTRYRYGGMSRNGIDCSAFSGQLFQDVYGVNLPRTAREQYDLTSRVAIEALKEGDLLFFNTRGGVSHVGVYLGDGYFVHSSTNSGVTISQLLEDYYRNHYIGAGRIQPDQAMTKKQAPVEEECL